MEAIQGIFFMNLNQLETNNSNKKSGNSYLQGKNLPETFLHTFGFFGDLDSPFQKSLGFYRKVIYSLFFEDFQK